MRNALRALTLLALASCASAGTAEEFRWSVDCPKSVDRGTAFTFTVRTARPGGAEISGVGYRYQIRWSGGNDQRHDGTSGTAQKLHARMTPGSASMVITGVGADGRDVTVVETSFEVK